MCRRAGLFSTTSMYRPHLPGVYRQRQFNSSIKALCAAFLNPASPYYLAPGTAGPASPDDVALPEQSSETHAKGIIHSSSQKQLYPSELGELLEQGREKLAQSGFQRSSIWQQNIVWGDQDPFQHVNNVQYVRFFESSRIHWMVLLGHRLGGPEKVDALLKGKGISLIIKALNITYRRPVTYPDTLLISHKPVQSPKIPNNSSTREPPPPSPPSSATPNRNPNPNPTANADFTSTNPNTNTSSTSTSTSPSPLLYPHSSQLKTGTGTPLPLPSSSNKPDNDPSILHLTSSAFSVSQQSFVAHCHETLVWYDYSKLKKSAPGEEYMDAIWGPYRTK